MRVHPLIAGVALVSAVAAVPLPAAAQTTRPGGAAATRGAPAVAADVPITRVALFSSGVGFFEHFGNVAGTGDATLRFKTEQINDVLKSLVLQDLDGGSIGSVSYPSQDPLGRALKGFQIDLSESPSIAQLLAQLRGADVVVQTTGNRYEGKILGVESRKKPGGDKAVVDVPTLNVITREGIRSVAIDEAHSIQLTDARLQDELNKALAAVGAVRDSDKKNVTIHFKGEGDRRVRIGYVVETPVWKTSYRLVIDDKDGAKSNLQGWAIVENQTDADWSDVQLSLVSGRPISFMMDLYEPLYLPRPTAKLELFEGLAPRTYAEARGLLKDAGGADQLGRASTAAPATPAAAARRKLASGFGGGGGGGGAVGGAAADEAANLADRYAAFGVTESIAAQASSGQIGELFEYTIGGIKLPRQSSAMVPIITDPIQTTRVSIYNQSQLARHPLSGARLKNTTDKHLLQGPITVFQGGGYAGDAQINNVPPGQERLISYGIDLQTLIDAEKLENNSEVQSLRLVKGVLEVRNKTVQSRHYKLENKSDTAKTILIEHPKIAGWELVEPKKPTEETDQLYRFEQKLESKAAGEVVVRQQIVNFSAVALLNTDLNTLQYYVNHGKTSPKVREALVKAISLRQQQSELDRQINESNEQLNQITQEQNRIRENMKTVERGSSYYTRLMTKLDEQESLIERTQAKVKEVTAARDAKRGELEAYLNTLDLE